MAEVLVEFPDLVVSSDAETYLARACGSQMRGGLWQGWIEFTPAASGDVLRSGRETTQPSREDVVYWATGLTPVYLEGALVRALTPRVEVRPAEPMPAAYDEPAPPVLPPPPATHGVLNPFSVYQKGEVMLRRQLAALSDWHLVNIIRAHGMSERSPEELELAGQTELIELIVAAVKMAAEITPAK